MIIKIKDRHTGINEYESDRRERFVHNYQYTIDSSKILYISDESYNETFAQCRIYLMNGRDIPIYSHSYEDINKMIYENEANF